VGVLELQSSIAFGLASLLLAVDSALVRVAGSCLLVVHVLPELHADGGCGCCWTRCSSPLRRAHAHGRYLASATEAAEDEGPAACRAGRSWNLAQSAAVLVGGLLQAVAYGFRVVESSDYYEPTRDGNGEPSSSSWLLDVYLDLNAAASSLFFVSGLLVLLSGRLGCCHRGNSGDPVKLDGWIDGAANVLYAVGGVCLFAGAINQIQNYDESSLGQYLQTAAAVLWIAAAILYVSSDGWRLCGDDCSRKEGIRSASAAGTASRSDSRRSRRRAQAPQNPVQETSSSSSGSEEGGPWWYQENRA
jgi:hypothetical protein